MDDLIIVEENINRVLQSLDQQLRGFEQTVTNLKSLLDPLDEPRRERCLNHLFLLLVGQIRRRSTSDPNVMNRQRQSIGILFKILFEYGRLNVALCSILAYLDVDNADVVNNWSNYVFQEITSAVYLYSNDLSPGTLATLKAHLALYSHPGTDLSRAMPALAPCVLQLNRAIESAEFSRFEQQLRKTSPNGPTPKEVGEQFTVAGLSSAVVGAMKEAAEYLRSDGQFNPKKAADLMRTSIDESHREIVARLAVDTGTPYTDANKDGARRAYLRKLNFISEPEEKFFSAIYTLLSEEASHRLIAPRETMLVMQQTVQNYLSLLVRRLSGFVPTRPKANP
jgi:hypothetical protein